MAPSIEQIKALLAEGNNLEVYEAASEVYLDSGILTDMLTDSEREQCTAEYGDFYNYDWDWEEAMVLFNGTCEALALIDKLRELTGIGYVEDLCKVVDFILNAK